MPWLLRPELLSIWLSAGTLLWAMAPFTDDPLGSMLTTPLRVLLVAGLLIYAFHLLERSAVSAPRPPPVAVMVSNPFRYPGLAGFIGLDLAIGAAGVLCELLFAREGASLGVFLVALALAPMVVLSALSGELREAVSLRLMGRLLRLLGWLAVPVCTLVAASFVILQWLLAGADAAWTRALAGCAGVLACFLLAGRLLALRADELGLEAEDEDSWALRAAASADAARLDDLLRRLDRYMGVNELQRAMKLLDDYLVEERYAQDQRMHHLLSEWRHPRLFAEHARHMVARQLGERLTGPAWSVALAAHAADPRFLPLTLDDLATLVEAAEAPAQCRAALAMVRRVDTADTDDRRMARIWLAGAEVAAREGDHSRARVWLSRAETRFPEGLLSEERRQRRERLRRLLS